MWCCFNIIKLVFEIFVKYNLKKTESYKYGLSQLVNYVNIHVYIGISVYIYYLRHFLVFLSVRFKGKMHVCMLEK